MSSSKDTLNVLPDENEVRSDRWLSPEVSGRSKTSKRETTGLMQKGRIDAKVMSINTAAAQSTSSHSQEEQLDSPLRLALARRSVKRKIFTYMDQGDKKTDIESRTGLSHQCIKWHRQMWRSECSHPRPQSKTTSQSSSRRAKSPSPRNERASKKRPACDEKSDLSAVSECNGDKRRRKHRAVKQSIARPVCVGTNKPESGGGNCAEKERSGSLCLKGKENMPGKDETLMLSVLPIRDLGP